MLAKYAELNVSRLSRDRHVRKAAYRSDRTVSGGGHSSHVTARSMHTGSRQHVDGGDYGQEHHLYPASSMAASASTPGTQQHYAADNNYTAVNVDYAASKSSSSTSSVGSVDIARGTAGASFRDIESNLCCGGSYWFIRDCCGIVCAVITYMLILYAEFVVMFVLLIPGPNYIYSMANAIVFNATLFLAVASHVKTMLTDPGAVPKFRDIDIYNKELLERLGLLREGQIVLKCAKCANIKPERAHHCSICRRCIRKMDHHCPWVNNCIGEKNQKFFVLFTMYISISSCHALILVASQAFICNGIEWPECTGFNPPSTIIFLMILVFEGLLFFIFTLIMCITQLQSICYDETGIEKLKKEASGRRISKLDSLREVFGSTFSIHWFNPFETPRVLGNVPYWYTV